MHKEFLTAYKQYIASCLNNNFDNNWDELRFGAKPKLTQKSVRQLIKEILTRIGLHDPVKSVISLLGSSTAQLQWLYEHLADEESREILVWVLAYRALGHRKVKLPLNNPQYWKVREDLDNLAINCESMDLGWGGRKAYKMDLSTLGYDIKLFLFPFTVIYSFILHQYDCKLSDRVIKASDGDIVIDAGGCFGDTALYFAHEVGKKGRVYSLEFIPENLALFERNMLLNPELDQRVKLLRSPLWSKSGEQLFVEAKGPASRVVEFSNQQDATRVETLAIDDLVDNEQLKRLDFIKMDIEGAELEALRGAEQSIRKFRPKLAICVYHKLNDFWEIPKYLDSLGLEYRFSLRHFTIHAEETVLFAY